MKKVHLKFITIRLLPEEAKVLKLLCQKTGTMLFWHFNEVEGFENESRTVDILFDILQTIEEARMHQDAETLGR